MTDTPGHLTLAMIKPHAVRARRCGDIIKRIEEAGFSILIVKAVQLRKEGAETFYAEHQGKDFFENLINVMCSGPVWAMVLYKHDAVKEWRDLMGATNPAQAEPGTLRYEFGEHENITNNAVHGSASDEEARREIGFFFGREIKLGTRIHEVDKQRSVL